MNKTDLRDAPGVMYELRALTNRWVEPTAGPVLSRHTSAKAAMEAFNAENRPGTDGYGRSTTGGFVPRAIIRIDTDSTETVLLPPPAGPGLLEWPYN